MSLSAGTRLGPYEILAPAGAGGMGEVYRARDLRLDRTVAVKVLSTHLSANPDLKQRFEREARAISSLNHPHICHLYDVGSQKGTDFLVMEFVEGQTLAQRLEKGPLPLDEALKVGIAIADALDKAHRQGIVHRDLKPGNIMLTKAGAKLMDFGLAKPAVGALGTSLSPVPITPSTPTVSLGALVLSTAPEPITKHGTIVGTFQYMAPEVLQGAEADARSDLFSFGCVLYEMITGRRAFEGKSQISVLAAILEHEPQPLSALQPAAPPSLGRLIASCLAKDPEERLACAHDLKLQVRGLADSRMDSPQVVRTGARVPSRLAWAVTFAAVALAAGSLFMYRQTQRQPDYSIHASILPPEKSAFEFMQNVAGPAVISPNGRRIAFTAKDPNGAEEVLWVRSLNSAEAQPLPHTDGASYPFWSWDGRYIGFFSRGKLKKVDAAGGPPVPICNATNARGGAWGPSDVILFTPSVSTALYRVSAGGGDPVQITELNAAKGENSHRWPAFLPDGKHFLMFVRSTGDEQGNQIYVAELDSKQRKLVTHSDSQAVYVAPGFLLFVRDGTLMAQPFDADKLATTGEPQAVAEHVAWFSGTQHGMFAASQTGTLLYQQGAGSGASRLAWVGRDGKLLKLAFPEADVYRWPKISPDGKHLAVTIQGRAPSMDVWLIDLERQTKTRVTFAPGFNDDPVWSADGRTIYFSSTRVGQGNSGIYRKVADGTGKEEPVLADNDVSESPWSASADGRFLLYTRMDPKAKTKLDIWALPLKGGGQPFPVVATEFNDVGPALSPDGKWLAYFNDESGTYQVYIRPFPSGDGKYQVSTDQGTLPVWRKDGKELFFFHQYRLYAVDVSENGSTLVLGAPHELFDGNSVPGTSGAFDVTPDGKRFLINASTDSQAQYPLTLVTNWTADLKK